MGVRGPNRTRAQDEYSIAQVLAEMRSVELFVEEELMVNITEHTLVPTHVPLTEAEKKQLLAR